MIGEIINNKEKYFWSKSVDEENEFKVGGYDAGKFYGMVRFRVAHDHIFMLTDVSNGLSSAQSLPSKRFDSGTHEFLMLETFFKELATYIEMDATKENHASNPVALLSNLFKLLPKYLSR